MRRTARVGLSNKTDESPLWPRPVGQGAMHSSDLKIGVAPLVERTCPLNQAPEAMRHLGTGHAQGKLVIEI